jgi:hypothetical protein
MDFMPLTFVGSSISPGLDHQHIRTLGDFAGRKVERAGDVGDDAARLDLGDVEDLLPAPEVEVTIMSMSPSRLS